MLGTELQVGTKVINDVFGEGVITELYPEDIDSVYAQIYKVTFSGDYWFYTKEGTSGSTLCGNLGVCTLK